MAKLTISGIEPTDVLGIAMFVVGAVVMTEYLPPNSTDQYAAGVVLMILGIAAVFGKDTFKTVLDMFGLGDEETETSRD